jgi:hypothetical protein
MLRYLSSGSQTHKGKPQQSNAFIKLNRERSNFLRLQGMDWHVGPTWPTIFENVVCFMIENYKTENNFRCYVMFHNFVLCVEFCCGNIILCYGFCNICFQIDVPQFIPSIFQRMYNTVFTAPQFICDSVYRGTNSLTSECFFLSDYHRQYESYR